MANVPKSGHGSGNLAPASPGGKVVAGRTDRVRRELASMMVGRDMQLVVAGQAVRRSEQCCDEGSRSDSAPPLTPRRSRPAWPLPARELGPLRARPGTRNPASLGDRSGGEEVWIW